MFKRLAVLALMFALTVAGFAQKGGPRPQKKPGGSVVDKAYLQQIWDGWATLDAAGQKKYYAQGPHVFFDIAPLKYSNWDEYQATVAKELEDYKAAKFTVNDDAQIHRAGDSHWITATIASDMTHKSGKHEMGTFRWTAVFEQEGGKWLIVHEHVSEPLP